MGHGTLKMEYLWTWVQTCNLLYCWEVFILTKVMRWFPFPRFIILLSFYLNYEDDIFQCAVTLAH